MLDRPFCVPVHTVQRLASTASRHHRRPLRIDHVIFHPPQPPGRGPRRLSRLRRRFRPREPRMAPRPPIEQIAVEHGQVDGLTDSSVPVRRRACFRTPSPRDRGQGVDRSSRSSGMNAADTGSRRRPARTRFDLESRVLVEPPVRAQREHRTAARSERKVLPSHGRRGTGSSLSICPRDRPSTAARLRPLCARNRPSHRG